MAQALRIVTVFLYPAVCALCPDLFRVDELVLLIVGVNSFNIPVFTCFLFPDPVSGCIVVIAEYCILPVFFQKLSAHVILTGDLQRAASVGCRSLRSCFGKTVPIAVIPVTEGQQDVASHAGFQMRYVAVCIILIRRLYSVPVVNLLQTVQTVVAVPDFHSSRAADPAGAPKDIVLTVRRHACGVCDLRDLSGPVIHVGDQPPSAGALFF